MMPRFFILAYVTRSCDAEVHGQRRRPSRRRDARREAHLVAHVVAQDPLLRFIPIVEQTRSGGFVGEHVGIARVIEIFPIARIQRRDEG